MHRRSIFKAAVLFIIIWSAVFSGRAFCQDSFEKALAKKLDSLLTPGETRDSNSQLFPNDALQTITIPSGFGGYGSYVFGGLGGVYPQTYLTRADLITSGGFCVGNPIKAINFALSVNMTDVHRFRDFSANFIISRIVFTGTSISAGGLQLFANKAQSDAPGSTFYFAVSHAVQTLPSATPGSSKLTYTIGIGNGRFYNKSFLDIAAGRGKHGTAVFAGISYELIEHVNLDAEWSAMNLGVSLGIRPFKNPLSLGIGAINLTRYSADKPNMVFSLGYPLSLSRQSN
jgi:hypothetical protein